MTVSVSVTHLEFCPSFRLVLVTQIRCNSLAVIKTLHHVHELFEVDFTVAILVDFHDSLCDLILCVEVLKFIAADELQNLLVVDFAAAIDIKHGEGRLQVGLLSKDLGVHRCRQKFSVVDVAITVCICRFQKLEQLLAILPLAESAL